MDSGLSRTLRQIGDATLRLVGDYEASGHDGQVWFTWSDVVLAVNRALLDLARESGCLRRRAVVAVTEDVNVYDLPSDCLRLLRLSLHGREGWAVTPISLQGAAYQGGLLTASGDPARFFRDLLEPNQIAVWPIPYRSGSTFTRDSDTGMVRGIRDAAGNYLPYDANRPLRRVTGVPFTRSGDGQIVREVVPSAGNLVADYIRTPRAMEQREEYPDVPAWIQPRLCHGAARELLMGPRGRKVTVGQVRLQRASIRWAETKQLATRVGGHSGLHQAGMVPV